MRDRTIYAPLQNAQLKGKETSFEISLVRK